MCIQSSTNTKSLYRAEQGAYIVNRNSESPCLMGLETREIHRSITERSNR